MTLTELNFLASTALQIIEFYKRSYHVKVKINQKVLNMYSCAEIWRKILFKYNSPQKVNLILCFNEMALHKKLLIIMYVRGGEPI